MARPRKRDWWIERVRDVEREFLIARRAVDAFMEELNAGRAELPPDTEVRDANAMSENLDGTFLVRLFSAFESGLRNFYATRRSTVPPAKDLIDAVAGMCDIADDKRELVHEVRVYRNALVHETDAEVSSVSIDKARRWLCRFFSHLPANWG